MTVRHPERDEPDPMLAEAAYAGRLYASDLSAPERRFVVEHLTGRGDTADRIAERLHCSKRLVQRIRSEVRAAS